ncbi:MAG: sigma-70 family RNA polymerase sigma factor [Actinomycetota bacterium]|nr:sigma-70 family RNA polymerase sigma factor [Actinomycetota bacterium]
MALRVAGARLRDADAAEEVAQETLLRLWRSAQRLKAADTPEAWVVRVTGNEVLRYVERRGRRVRHEVPETEGAAGRAALVAAAPQPPEERAMLAAAVRRLPPQDRTIVALHYFGDVPLSTIAQQLTLPLGTVKARLSRARGRMRRELSS